jgi:hypothetical protein
MSFVNENEANKAVAWDEANVESVWIGIRKPDIRGLLFSAMSTVLVRLL